MRIGFFSDIHSNLEALEAVLAIFRQASLDQIVCLGDLVGYGPDPNACVERTMEATDVVLAGNHDYASVEMETLKKFTEDARTALRWTRDQLTESNAKILRELPMRMLDGEIMGVHATPDDPRMWFYLKSQKDAERCLKMTPVPFCFVGHSHVPIIFMQDSENRVAMEFGMEIKFYEETKYIINVGSVGQPRDGDPRASYGIMDTEKGTFYIGRCAYDIQKVQKKMILQDLPLRLVHRLTLGK